MTFFVQREIEFDASHRVHDHRSKCSNPHGHRYKVVAKVGSRTLAPEGSSTGMVIDFGDISELLKLKIHDELDHRPIIYRGDAAMMKAFDVVETPDDEDYNTVVNRQGWTIVIFPYTPTAENIAKWVFEELVYDIDNMSSAEHVIWLESIAVYETPKSVAIFERKESTP